MSVTFSVTPAFTERIEVIGYHFESGQKKTIAIFESDDQFRQHVITNGGRENIWAEYDWYSRLENLNENQPEVQMSNGNARVVLLALDLNMEDMYGAENATTFKARVLVALATDRLDDGMPGYKETGENGATIYWGGRDPGYVNDKLIQLLKVAEAAEKIGVDVQWG